MRNSGPTIATMRSPESATAAPASDGSYVVGEINGDYEQLPA